MTSRKTLPNSKPGSVKTNSSTDKKNPPARVATTIATGSTDPMDPGEAGTPSTATVHDLVGVAVLILPPDVRTALGDRNLLGSALELETQEILVIARENGVVAYIHLPIVVKEMEFPGSELRSGMVLHDITGKYARQKATDQAGAPVKPKAKAKATKPSGKAGRHA
jgi:hypothetical protein